jgi:glycerol-3-phosphate acyltransferase PlsY
MQNIWMPLLFSYLIGALPFAYTVSKISKDIDPREVGDHNPGTRNVFKHVGKKEGVIVGILDISKGVAVILLGKYLGIDVFGQFAMGFMVIAGHNWPVFMKFNGGQGMAATIGVLWALLPIPSTIGLGIGVITYLLTHHWNFTCGVGLVLIPIVNWLLYRDISVSLYATGLLPIIGIRAWMQAWAYRRNQETIDNGQA